VVFLSGVCSATPQHDNVGVGMGGFLGLWSGGILDASLR
jgi:hypothetical protein